MKRWVFCGSLSVGQSSVAWVVGSRGTRETVLPWRAWVLEGWIDGGVVIGSPRGRAVVGVEAMA